MDPSFLIFILIIFAVMFLMTNFGKRQQAKRDTAHKEMLENELQPGVWVQTVSGFFGRFVDRDGDVVILETPSGEETYWIGRAIRGVGEPPFEVVEIEEEDVEPLDDTVEEFDFGQAEVDLAEVDTSDDSDDASEDKN